MAVLRHHARRQRIEEQRDVRRVLGQRRHSEGIAREYHQSHLPTGTLAQQRGQLGPRLGQPRRRQIARQGGAGQVQRNHQRLLRLPQRLFVLAEAGAGQGDDRQCGRAQRQPARPCARAICRTALQQVRQQVGVDHVAPRIAALRLAAPPPRKHRQYQQRQQPPRAQEMTAESRFTRLRSSSASTPMLSAPSGPRIALIFGRTAARRLTGPRRSA
jgi:hypothetical protein